MADNTRFFDIQKAVYTQLNDNWAGLATVGAPVLPILLDNDAGEDRDGEDFSNGWVHIQLGGLDGNQASINGNNPLLRTTGAIAFNIVVPRNKSNGLALTYASQIAEMFDGTRFDGVQMRICSLAAARLDNKREGQWWLTPLICGFYYDNNITILE